MPHYAAFLPVFYAKVTKLDRCVGLSLVRCVWMHAPRVPAGHVCFWRGAFPQGRHG